MKIHPSAIVSPQARLADDVEIGPGTIIGDDVTLGAGCVVGAHVILEGKTTLGERNHIGHGAIIGSLPQDFAFKETVKSEVRIGHGNTFREYVTIHRGTEEGSATIVGHQCYLMVGVHLGHNTHLADKVIIANNCLLAGHVEVGGGAVLGGGSVFHQFMRIGTLVMVRGGTRFGKDIPPYVSADGENIISGINAIGLRRAGFSAEIRLEIKRAFKLAYWSRLNISQAVEKAKEKTWSKEAQVFLDFLASSKRGVCSANRAPDSGKADEASLLF